MGLSGSTQDTGYNPAIHSPKDPHLWIILGPFFSAHLLPSNSTKGKSLQIP